MLTDDAREAFQMAPQPIPAIPRSGKRQLHNELKKTDAKRLTPITLANPHMGELTRHDLERSACHARRVRQLMWYGREGVDDSL